MLQPRQQKAVRCERVAFDAFVPPDLVRSGQADDQQNKQVRVDQNGPAQLWNISRCATWSTLPSISEI